MLRRGHASSADAFTVVARLVRGLWRDWLHGSANRTDYAHAMHGHSGGLAFAVEHASARLVVGF